MRYPKDRSFGSSALAFLVAVVVATVWGAVVQTQFNLAALVGIGAEIPAGLRLQATLTDLFGGFFPTYAGYIVLPALLVAFAVAWWITSRGADHPALWFAAGGGLALLVGIPLVNYLAPVALLIGAARDGLCTFLMALGGVVAGLVFVAMPGGRRDMMVPTRPRTVTGIHPTPAP
jgi:hypothetical protein